MMRVAEAHCAAQRGTSQVKLHSVTNARLAGGGDRLVRGYFAAVPKFTRFVAKGAVRRGPASVWCPAVRKGAVTQIAVLLQRQL